MYETMYGAGYGYGYDVADVGGLGYNHTHFVVWLAVFVLAALAVLGGLKFGGFHFVVRV